MRQVVRTKAWDRKEKKFVYDFVIDSVGNYYQCSNGEFYGDSRELTIIQSTGSLDKNMKEIFEGDIIKEFMENELGSFSEDVGIVTWCNHHVGFEVRTKNYDPATGEHMIGSNCEVVGNIFENANLIQ